MKERREAIRHYIESRGEVTIGQLAAEFTEWSEMTLRRDLDFLAAEKVVILTRGGARLIPSHYGFLGEDIYSERELRNYPLKQAIAAAAAKLVQPGKGIFIDAGTTAMSFARALPDYRLVVVTSAPNIALEVAMQKKNPSVVQLGGTLSRNTISVSDPAVAAQLSALNIDTAFMCASGFDERAGFSVGSQLDCLLKREVISRARRVVMMIDSSKIGALLPFSFASPDEVDLCITDDGVPAELRRHWPEKIQVASARPHRRQEDAASDPADRS